MAAMIKSVKYPLLLGLIIVLLIGIATTFYEGLLITIGNPKPTDDSISFRADKSMVIEKKNYPKCEKIQSLEQELLDEVNSRDETISKFKKLHDENELFCGTARKSKRSIEYFLKTTILGYP